MALQSLRSREQNVQTPVAAGESRRPSMFGLPPAQYGSLEAFQPVFTASRLEVLESDARACGLEGVSFHLAPILVSQLGPSSQTNVDLSTHEQLTRLDRTRST